MRKSFRWVTLIFIGALFFLFYINSYIPTQQYCAKKSAKFAIAKRMDVDKLYKTCMKIYTYGWNMPIGGFPKN